MYNERHTLICPPRPEVIGAIECQDIIVRTSHLSGLPQIVDAVNDRNILHSVLCITDGPVTSLQFTDEFRKVPFVVFAAALGDFKRFMMTFDLLKSLNVSLFLPSDQVDTYTHLKILSSLGISCGIRFSGARTVDWYKAREILAYSYFNRAKHAAIEPFQYALLNYQNNQLMLFETPFYRNHTKYLHITENGGIALSLEEADRGEAVAELSELSRIRDNPAYIARGRTRERFFLERHECSFCPVWRLCGGTFAETAGGKDGCQRLFGDMLEAIDLLRSRS